MAALAVIMFTHRSCNSLHQVFVIHTLTLIYPSIFSFYFFTSFLALSFLLFQPFYHSGKINDFNLEEEAYGWSVSQYPERKKIQDKLTPFLRLYETATDFQNQYEQWLHGPLTGVNPDKVRAVEKWLYLEFTTNTVWIWSCLTMTSLYLCYSSSAALCRWMYFKVWMSYI